MGFRTYDPGLNRYLTRDSYNGALNDLALGTDPWNTNRYAFAGGNPIGRIELDGHMTLDGGSGAACDEQCQAALTAHQIPESAPDSANTVYITGSGHVEAQYAKNFDPCAQTSACNAGVDASTTVHTALAVTGLVPGAEAFDLADAGLYLAEGRKVDAAISVGAAVPLAGWGATGIRLVRKSGKVTNRGADAANTKPWLHGTHGNAGHVPDSVRSALSGRAFNSWDEFRGEFWKAASADPALAGQFSASNQRLMSQGLAPFVHGSQTYGGRMRYELHHVIPRSRGGGAYDLDNLVVATPRYHAEILSPSYHYGGGR